MRSREELQRKFKKYISRPRSKAELHSKFRHYMSKPVQPVDKARDFYVKSLEDCASKVGGHDGLLGCPAPQVSRLPKNFNFNYSKSNNDEKFMKFLETMSKKRSMESDLQV
ncbi:Detected protein of unknown function [Hibiscus syriacus]|uniref:Uncharacterized protein n=1 Tax=Hibiscus syriacus TaxID=106335 RepID=A0A6A2YCB6_HIBSY|nr:Detected protein of unknown function [Hibiscus syriacus]